MVAIGGVKVESLHQIISWVSYYFSSTAYFVFDN